MSILLLGGNGFLGSGLQDELKNRRICYKSIDKEDYDLINYANINKCVDDLKDATHVVVLASKIGIELFNADPISASKYNSLIHNFIIDAIKAASKLYQKSYNVTYYSTSEVYGSLKNKDEVITEHTPYSFIQNNDRYLYSYVKHQAETDYFKLNYEHPEIVSSIKIVHPFNIYGKYQQRGVAYSMVKSALEQNVIWYNEYTTRTLTSLKLASKMSVDVILSDTSKHVNVADPRCSLTLKSLAYIIKDILDIPNIMFVSRPPDKLIQYRHVSTPDADTSLARNVMNDEILELAEQISLNANKIKAAN